MNISKQTNVLVILSPGSVLGGAEFYATELTQGLNSKTNIKCTILYSHNKNCGVFLDSYNVPSRWIGDNIWKCAFRLAKLVHEYNPSVIHSNGYHSNFIVTIFKFLYYPKLRKSITLTFSCTEHGWIRNNVFEIIKTFFDNFTLKCFDAVFVVEPGMKEIVLKYKQNNVYYSPSFINFDRLENKSIHKIEKCETERVIMAIGRLSQEKRFDMFLDIASYLNSFNTNYCFKIIGDGNELDNLKLQAKRLGIESRVQFIGFIENTIDYYRSADALLICSDTEGCPRVAVEAMNSKTLVVSREVGHMLTLLASDRGILFPYNTSSFDVAKQIDKVLNSKRKKSMIVDAYNYVNSEHTIENAIKVYLKVFNNLCWVK